MEHDWSRAGEFAELVFGAVQRQPRLRVAGKFMLRALGIFNPFLCEEQLLQAVVRAVLQFTDGEQQDDITLVIARSLA